MADRYLLENNVDRILLENGTDLLALDVPPVVVTVSTATLTLTGYAPSDRASPPYVIPSAISTAGNTWFSSGTGNASVFDINDNPSVAGGNYSYMVAPGGGDLYVDFPTPNWTLSSTANALKMRLRCEFLGGNTGEFRVTENGTTIATLALDGSMTGLIELPFSKSSLVDQTGALVRAEITNLDTGTEGCRVYAVDWYAPEQVAAGNVTVTPSPANLNETTFAPTIRLNKIATAGLATLTVTRFAPQIKLSVVPPVGALSIATFAPTVSTPRLATPPVRSLTTTGLAPVVTATNHQTVVPSTTSLTTTGFQPSVSRAVVPLTRSLTLSTFAPAVLAPRIVNPSMTALTTTKYAPRIELQVVPALQTLALTAYAPQVLAPRTTTPGLRALTLATFTPNVTFTAHVNIVVPVKNVVTIGPEPTVVATQNALVRAGLANLTLTAFSPAVSTSDAITLVPATRSLTVETFAPSVTATANVTVAPQLGAVNVVGFVPQLRRVVVTGLGVVTVTGFAPHLGNNVQVATDAGSLVTGTLAPSVGVTDNRRVIPNTAVVSIDPKSVNVIATGHRWATPDRVHLSLAPRVPTVFAGNAIEVVPDPYSLGLIPFAPLVGTSDHKRVVPPKRSLELATYAGTVYTPRVSVPATKALGISMYAPTVRRRSPKIPGAATVLIVPSPRAMITGSGNTGTAQFEGGARGEVVVRDSPSATVVIL